MAALLGREPAEALDGTLSSSSPGGGAATGLGGFSSFTDPWPLPAGDGGFSPVGVPCWPPAPPLLAEPGREPALAEVGLEPPREPEDVNKQTEEHTHCHRFSFSHTYMYIVINSLFCLKKVTV